MEGSWTDTFAPKIESSHLTTLKKDFLDNYTSEVVTPCTMPSTRLISLAAHQETKKDFEWIPWRFRMTQSRSEELQMQRQPKQARLETMTLHSLLLDEPPSMEVRNSNMGPNAVRQILTVHGFARAMLGTAHLVRLKAYSTKFLDLLTMRYDQDSGLRPLTILKAQSADKHIWTCVFQLVLEKHLG